MDIYIYVLLNHFTVHQKLTQHCKLTIPQFKKKCNGKNKTKRKNMYCEVEFIKVILHRNW